jgi:hypothetical protein
MPLFRLLTYQLNTPGEAIARWAIADNSRNRAIIGPKGRLMIVSVTGASFSVVGMKLRNEVVMGSEKSLLKKNIVAA